MGPNGLQNVKSFTSFIMDKGAVIVHGAGTRHKENFNKWLLRREGQLTLKKKEWKKFHLDVIRLHNSFMFGD